MCPSSDSSREVAGSVPAASIAHVYSLPPIDRWDGWTPLAYAYGAALGAVVTDSCEGFSICELASRAVEAAHLFTLVGWEGDGVWRVAPLPAFDWGVQDVEFLLAVKQNNNGSTFLLSPVELPWLDEYRER